jgi:hypothetical protein
MQFDDYIMQKVWDKMSTGEKLMVKVAVLREMLNTSLINGNEGDAHMIHSLAEHETNKLNNLT